MNITEPDNEKKEYGDTNGGKTESEKKIREISEILKLTTIVSNIGFTMVGCIIAGFFAGFAIEHFILKKFFSIKPNAITVLIFTLLGVCAGFLNVYKFITKKILNFKIEKGQDNSDEK